MDLPRASVAGPEQVTRMFEDIERRFGRLDILLNNAADGALRTRRGSSGAHDASRAVGKTAPLKGRSVENGTTVQRAGGRWYAPVELCERSRARRGDVAG